MAILIFCHLFLPPPRYFVNILICFRNQDRIRKYFTFLSFFVCGKFWLIAPGFVSTTKTIYLGSRGPEQLVQFVVGTAELATVQRYIAKDYAVVEKKPIGEKIATLKQNQFLQKGNFLSFAKKNINFVVLNWNFALIFRWKITDQTGQDVKNIGLKPTYKNFKICHESGKRKPRTRPEKRGKTPHVDSATYRP